VFCLVFVTLLLLLLEFWSLLMVVWLLAFWSLALLVVGVFVVGGCDVVHFGVGAGVELDDFFVRLEPWLRAVSILC